jgi:arginine deiminase
MFGSVSAVGDQGFSDARFLIELAKLMVDPQAVADRLEKLFEEGKRIEAARAEHDERQRLPELRQQTVSKLERDLEQRAAQVAEQERLAADKLAKAEQRMSEFEELRAELRNMAA